MLQAFNDRAGRGEQFTHLAVVVAMDSALALPSPMLMTSAWFWPMDAIHKPVTTNEADLLADTAMMILDETYWKMREEEVESYVDLCSRAQKAALVMAGEGEELIIEGDGRACLAAAEEGEECGLRRDGFNYGDYNVLINKLEVEIHPFGHVEKYGGRLGYKP